MAEGKQYHVIQTVATGGTAVLYKAVQISLDRVVAVKRLHAHLTTDDNFTRRFVQEAKAVATLDHENIVNVIDFGVEDGSYQMVMEFVEGESLKDIMDRWRPIRYELALAFVHQVCLGLEHAHSKGIVHRDIKPGNLLFTRTGKVKIADFGLAKLTEGTSMHTADDSILGTPLYMSPEQATGEGVDQRSDLFSLGTVLYELVTGRQPFAGANYASIIQNILTKEVPSVRESNRDIPADVDAMVSKALTKDRDGRFQSACEFRWAIEQHLGLERLNELAASLPMLFDPNAATHVLAKAPPTKGESGSVTSSRRAGAKAANRRAPPRRGSGRRAFAAVAAVLGLGGGAFAVMWTLGFFAPSSDADVSPREAPSSSSLATPIESELGPLLASIESLTTVVPDLPRNPAVDSAAATEPVGARQTTDPPKDDASTTAAPSGTGTPATGPPAAGAAEDSSAHPHAEPPPASTPQPVKRPATEVEPERKPREGYLAVTAQPTAEVWVDGVYRGDASPRLRLSLRVGEHTLECKSPQHAPYTESLRIVPGELSNRNVTLKKLRGSISLTTQEGAELYIDGVFYGITPIPKLIELDTGTHTLALKKPQHSTWSSQVVVGPDKTLPLRITLSREY